MLQFLSRFLGLKPKIVIEVDNDKVGDECVTILNAINSSRTQLQFDTSLSMATRFERMHPKAGYHINLIRNEILNTEIRLLTTIYVK